MNEYIIELRDVSHSYGREDERVEVLRGLNLKIKRGEFVAILGHNGSGKSTIAKLINGILIPSLGDVLVNDMNTKSEEHIWDIRQSAGIVFQNPDNQLVATMVEEDVAFGPENQGIEPSEIRRRVDEALETVGMSQFKKEPPHMLSGGQKQRVAIAGILAMKPDCIIFDEPTAMLDPSGRRDVMETIKRLRDDGKTIVHITHYMEETIGADRLIVMDKGQIVKEGSPREVFSDVEGIKSLGLDVPQITHLAYELRAGGLDIDADVLCIEELVDRI